MPEIVTPTSVEVTEQVIGSIDIVAGGLQGPPGWSAYQLAVSQGFTGTLQEWLVSLIGIVVLDQDEPLPPPSTPVGTLVYRRVS